MPNPTLCFGRLGWDALMMSASELACVGDTPRSETLINVRDCR
jgi:hypothetical protein